MGMNDALPGVGTGTGSVLKQGGTSEEVKSKGWGLGVAWCIQGGGVHAW